MSWQSHMWYLSMIFVKQKVIKMNGHEILNHRGFS